MREVIRRNWRWWVTLAEVLVLTTFFAHYLGHRQTLANQRAERQRAALCDTLANIPGRIPPEIARDRVAFARPGHPNDCQPVKGAPVPKPTPIRVYINGHPATIIVVPPTDSASPAPKRSRPPTPRATPSPTPTPTPSPSRTCVPLTHICT